MRDIEKQQIHPSFYSFGRGKRRTRVQTFLDVLETLASRGPMIYSHIQADTLLGPSPLRKILRRLHELDYLNSFRPPGTAGTVGPSWSITPAGRELMEELRIVSEVVTL